MRATGAMTRNVVCIGPDDSLVDAYDIMIEWEIRHLPVLRGNALVGILSDRDVLLRSAPGDGDGIEVPNIPVSEAMTENPKTCSPTTDIASISEEMIEHKIDSLPVLDHGGRLIGLVTSTDLLQILTEKERIVAGGPLPFKFKIYAGVRPGMIATYS